MRACSGLAGGCLLSCLVWLASCGGDASEPRDGRGGAGGGASGGSGGATAGAAGHAGAGAAGASAGAAGSATEAGASGAGAAGSAAGAGGSNSRDAGVDVAPVSPCAGRLVCDDFETAAVGKAPAAPWSVRATKGSVIVDETRAFSGKRAVKVSITPTATTDTYRQAMLAVTGAPLIPLPGNAVYGRFMIYTDRIPDKSVHWTVAHGEGSYGAEYATYNFGGMGDLMANYYRATMPKATDCWQTKPQVFPSKAWTCVAFRYDGAANEIRVWLDGSEVPELHVLGNAKTDATCTEKGIDGRWLAPNPFKLISVGWESYQHDASGAHDAWIDDVVLDDEPIACPAPR